MRGARRAGLRGAGAALLALAALAALRGSGLRREASTSADFPHHSPAVLAHFLADFSNHPQLYTHITGAWQVEEESSNFSCWRYAVRYECGARCAGRAALLACGDAQRPRHGAPARHRLRLRDRRCWRLPALPWPRACQSLETDSVIGPREGGGARLEERAHAECGALAAVAGQCNVRAARLAHHDALRDALP